jgi:thioredoxin reductase (NADPH)
MKKNYLFLLLLCAIFVSLNQPLFSVPAEKESQQKGVSVVVFGGGIGALTSALYLARAGIEPLVIEGQSPGGLIVQSHSVQNWPGELEITGAELAEKVKKQASANGAIFSREEVTAVNFSKRPFSVTLKSLASDQTRTITADSIIIAMGTRPNFLSIPGETGPNGYWGRGVTNCAICDGALYRNLTVGVVGGGDAAVLEALYLSNIAKQVHIFVRKDALRAVERKRLETLLAKSNVKIFYNTTVEEVKGDGVNVTGVVLKTVDKKRLLALDGLFLAIGSKPNSELFKNVLELDPQGYIVLKKDQETSLSGVYAIGDIVDPIYKQAISAAGDGAKAAMQAQQSISDRGIGTALVKNKLPEPLPTRVEVIEILTIEQLQKEIHASDVPVFVDFYASWCNPCKQISPRIDQSATQLAGKVKFLKINIDLVEQKLPHTYQVRSMPTALLFNPEGQVIERKIGSTQVLDLLKSLEKNQDSGIRPK